MKRASKYVELQRKCQKILDELQAPQANSFEEICDWAQGLRGRPLILQILPEQAAVAGACGLWLGADDADYVFFEPHTARLHQEHIILHEIGHMLADHHRADASDPEDLARQLLDGLEPRLVKRLMARTSYTTSEEQEAEMIASLLKSVRKPRRLEGPLGRLGAFLGVTGNGVD